MSSMLSRFAEFFGAHQAPHRDAHERDRARQRAGISAMFALVVLAGAWRSDAIDGLAWAVALTAVAYAGMALMHLKLFLMRGRGSIASQYAFIVADSLVTVVLLVGAAPWLAAWYAVLIVQIVRCGIRYGLRTLWLSWAAAALSAALLMPFSDFWMSEHQLLLSFIAMMATVPLLFGPLIRNLHSANDELRLAAGSDPLTGLGNRRMLSEHIRLAKERSHRDGTLLAIILFDLDNFKGVNDTLGHAVGDQLLEEVSAAIRASCRAGDFLARVGGDEFVLLVEGLAVHSGRQQAHDIADKIVRVIQATAQRLAPGVGVSASVGIHCWTYGLDPGVSEAELVDAADRAMYAAKHAGKSCVVLSAA